MANRAMRDKQQISLYHCPSPRQEIKLLAELFSSYAGNPKLLSGSLVVLSDVKRYQPVVEAMFQHHNVPYTMQVKQSLAEDSLWHIWLCCHRLLQSAKRLAPLGDAILDLATSGLIHLEQAGRKRLQEILFAAPWNLNFNDYLERLAKESSLKELFELLNSLPGAKEWDANQGEKRQALLNSIVSYASKEKNVSFPAKDRLNEQLQKDLDLGELIATLRTTYDDNTLSFASGFLNVFGVDQLAAATVKEHLYIVGFKERELVDLKVAVTKNLTELTNHANHVCLLTPTYDIDGSEQRAFVLPQELTPDRKYEVDWAAQLDAEQMAFDTLVDSTYKPATIKLPTPLTSVSTSAVAQYALCPYRYFARYLLKLDAKETEHYFKLAPRRLGDVAHKILEIELPKVLAGAEIDKQQMQKLFVDTFGDRPLSVFENQTWIRLQQALIDRLGEEKEWLTKLTAKLFKLEAPFTLELDVAVDEGPKVIEVRGRMDRLDKLADGSLVVVDYKSSAQAVSPKERQQMAELVKPQLAIYLLAAREIFAGEPIAGFELRLKSGKRGGVVAEGAKKMFKSASFLKLADEDFLPHFENRLTGLVQGMAAGEFTPTPQSNDQCGLGACPYFGVCRFDLNETAGDSDA